MYDKTEELLPISMLHRILFEEEIFSDFLEGEGIFSDIEQEKSLRDLNDYMNLIIKTSGIVDDAVYDRMNRINMKFGNANIYYLKDIYATDKIVAIDDVEAILYDEKTFNKFMNFEEESDYFNAGSLLNYLIEIVDYFYYIDKKSMVIDYEVIKRYHEIMKKYSLDLKRYHRVNGEKSKGIINSEMEKEIFNSIDMNQDSFNISYQVYRELNKRCKYSSDHVALRAIGNKELAMDIYNKDISNIDKNDNDVTCNSWANMYAYLLVKLGFNARVCGKYHKYVEFDCDGTLMRADATEVNTKSRDGFSLNDITRCHLGLQVENFICLEEDKELDDIIDYAYHDSKDVNTEGIAELKRMEQFYKDEYFGTVAKTQTSEKILMIKKKCLESGLHDAELSKYIDLLMRISFSYQELRDMDVNYIAVKDDTKYSLSVIFNMGESYYIFDDKIGLIVKSKNEVIKDFNDGSLVLVGKNARCKLLEDKEENVYARVG